MTPHLSLVTPDETSPAARARQLQAEAASATDAVAAEALSTAFTAASRLQVASELLDHAPALRDRVSKLAVLLYAELTSIEAMRQRSGR